jgi:hypothetical protein
MYYSLIVIVFLALVSVFKRRIVPMRQWWFQIFVFKLSEKIYSQITKIIGAG